MSNRRSKSFRRFDAAEFLEPRRLLASSLHSVHSQPESGGLLNVVGTTDSDTIIIEIEDDNLKVTVNGSAELWPDAAVTAIDVDALEGDDQIFLESNGDNPTVIHGQSGTDDVFLAQTGKNLDLISSPVLMEGGPEGANLWVFDSLNTFTDPYTITNSTLSRALFGGVSFSELNSLELTCQDFASTVNVQSTPPCPIMINGAGGDDVCHFGPTNLDLESLDGILSFDGGEGDDQVYLHDENSSSDNTWLIDGTSISRTLVDPIVCDAEDVFIDLGAGNNDVQLTAFAQRSLTIDGSTGDDELVVSGLAGNSSVFFNGRAGSDALSVQSTAAGSSIYFEGGNDPDSAFIGSGDLDTVSGAISFTGGPQFDHLTLIDDLNGGTSSYTLSSDQIMRSDGFGGLSYAQVENLVLSAQQGDNVIDIHSTMPAMAISIWGNEGNDVMNVAADSGDLSNIRSTANISGGAGDDELYFHDQFRAGDLNYSLTDGQLMGEMFPTQNISEAELVVLMTGSGANVIDVSNNSLLQQMVFSGEGDDVINVAETLTPVQINGGVGLDQFNIGTDAPGNAAQATAIAENGQRDDLQFISIHAGCSLSIADDHLLTSPGELVTGTLSFGTRSTYIALASRAAMTLEQALSYTLAGYSGGAWVGMGSSFSSTASAVSSVGDGIGYARAADIEIDTFKGVNVSADDLIFTQTLYGDANLDYVVDFNDLLKIAQNYNTDSNYWFDADFTYDQFVDFNDLLRVAQNYGRSTMPKRRPTSVNSILQLIEN